MTNSNFSSNERPEQISSADLWTIFTSCPIEKGSVAVYNEYVKAKEREKTNQNGLEM